MHDDCGHGYPLRHKRYCRECRYEEDVVELEKKIQRLCAIEKAIRGFDVPNGTAEQLIAWLESTTSFKYREEESN